ncbi:3-hydroxyacyl-CoA dehydrogenase [Aspergillus floccosus]
MTGSSSSLIDSKRVTIVGCGTIGRQIGLLWASKATDEVALYDTNEDAAKKAMSWILEQLPETSRLQSSAGECLAKITVCMSLQDAVTGSWLVMECTPEVIETKSQLLGLLDRCASPTTILSTNASAIKSGDLLSQVSEARRSRVLNCHYFWPPENPAVELMSCGQTDDGVIDLMKVRLQSMGLDPVVVLNPSTGFIANRIWAAIKREIIAVLSENVARPEDIDRLFKYGFQSKLAPCALMDRVGLQTVCNIEDHYIRERGDIRSTPVDFIRRNYVDKGYLGLASGKGLYDYSDGNVGEASFHESLMGCWELVDYATLSPSGERHSLREVIKGILIYAPAGLMSVHLQISKGSASEHQELPQEFVESGQHGLAYGGRFEVKSSGMEAEICHHIAYCSFKQWEGSSQKRFALLEKKNGSQLLTLACSMLDAHGSKSEAVLRWRKLADRSDRM